jgi:hypothetical protein
MKWIRKLFGTDFPDPQVGQVWRCTRNGEFMRVADVHTHTSGTVFVTCTYWTTRTWGGLEPDWGIGDSYAVGLSNWRARLREESRQFCGIDFDPSSVISDLCVEPV